MRDERDRERERDEAMLERLWNSDMELKRAAQEEGMTLWELAQWARKRRNKEAAAGLRVWATMVTELALSRRRVKAVELLLKIAESGQGDSARRACVDAIRLNVMPPDWGLERAAAGDGTAIEPYDDAAMIAQLKACGLGIFEQAALTDQMASEPAVRRRLPWQGGMP